MPSECQLSGNSPNLLYDRYEGEGRLSAFHKNQKNVPMAGQACFRTVFYEGWIWNGYRACLKTQFLMQDVIHTLGIGLQNTGFLLCGSLDTLSCDACFPRSCRLPVPVHSATADRQYNTSPGTILR